MTEKIQKDIGEEIIAKLKHLSEMLDKLNQEDNNGRSRESEPFG